MSTLKLPKDARRAPGAKPWLELKKHVNELYWGDRERDGPPAAKPTAYRGVVVIGCVIAESRGLPESSTCTRAAHGRSMTSNPKSLAPSPSSCGKRRTRSSERRARDVARRAKALNLLVGPMRPLEAGGEYDPSFHTYEVLSAAGLGASYDDLTLETRATFRPVLVPMDYSKGR